MQLNYKHLHYFWTVAKTGSIISASEVLHLTPQTISGQISQLEEAIGDRLFDRHGRRLTLTNKGKSVLKYADEIFSLGEELSEFLRGGTTSLQGTLQVGIMDAIPKIIAYKILAPTMDDVDINLTCREGSFEQLIAKLAIRELDLVISDMPVTTAYSIKAYNHKLGESPMTCFAHPGIASTLKGKFPKNLNRTNLLLPTSNSTIRPALDQWLMAQEINPTIVGEFDDSALLKAFGEAGAGAFFMPTIIEADVCQHYGVEVIGRTDKVREQFYALSLARQLNSGPPVLARIYDSARLMLSR